MKLVGKLKDKVEEATSKDEARTIIKEAGMELSEEELDKVSGGASFGFWDREKRKPK